MPIVPYSIPVAKIPRIATASSRNGSADSRQTFLYFGWLTLFVYLSAPAGHLVDIQTSYMRNPFGLRDRGYFLIFAPVTAAAFIWLAYARVSYRGLPIGMLLAMLASRFIAAAYQGLLALVGQERLMSGRLSALWNIVSAIPYIAGAAASGYISEHLPPKDTFFLVAAVTFFMALLGLWKPRSVFSHTYEKPQAARADFVGNVRRLVKGGTVVAVPQMIPLALIHSANLALALAVPIGLMGGIATGAYFDLAMR